MRIDYLIISKPMPEAQVIKQEFRNACLLKQVNVIGWLKVAASIQVTRSAEILNTLSWRECRGRQLKALYIIMCGV